MRLIDVEDWTSSVVESVLAGQPIEDARVELAADWIGPRDAARRVAAYQTHRAETTSFGVRHRP